MIWVIVVAAVSRVKRENRWLRCPSSKSEKEVVVTGEQKKKKEKKLYGFSLPLSLLE